MHESNMDVSSAMTKHVSYLTENFSLKAAYALMKQGEFRHIPVVDGDRRVVGVLSDRDILLAASADSTGKVVVPDVLVREAMSQHPVTCSESTKISDVAATLINKKIDALPIVDARRRLLGMVTSTDLMDLLVSESSPFRGEVLPFRYELAEVAEMV